MMVVVEEQTKVLDTHLFLETYRCLEENGAKQSVHSNMWQTY